MYNNKNHTCTNCNSKFHDYKDCNIPITSWGIILVDLSSLNYSINHNPINIKSHIFNITPTSREDLNLLGEIMPQIKFLLAQRKHSIGFVDFIRGKYKVDNIDGINFLFQHMIPEEISKISKLTFDELWVNLWNNDENKMNNIKKEYYIAKNKFTQLKEDTELDATLDFYINNVKSLYTSNEWGFPKGRKNKGENERDCAIREFVEETGIDSSKFNVIDSIEPIEENLTGTNGIKYKHIYYVAETKEKLNLSVENNNEIGQINFFSYNDGNNIIREYHNEKKEVLTSIYYYYLELILNSAKK